MAGGAVGAAAGGAACGEGGGVAGEGGVPVLSAGSGIVLSPGGRGRGGLRTGELAGGGGCADRWMPACGRSVRRAWGRGAGGGRVGLSLPGGGGLGSLLFSLGIRVSRLVLWVVCVSLGRDTWPLAGRGVGQGDGCLG